MHTRLLVVLIVLFSLALPASPAHASEVVSVCDEANLLAALFGGGMVTFTCSGTITLTSTITISIDTTIDGSGQTVTISGNNKVGVFSVSSGTTFSLNKLTVANGQSDYGGGILNFGTLNVSSTTFSGNSAYYWGGGIYNESGTLTVGHSTFSGNFASYGGGILNAATATVSDSTFFSNRAAGGGGGIFNTGTLDVSSSTFSGNLADYYGGGIFNDGTLDVSNSTFSGNNGFRVGGGIMNTDTATVSNSTFSSNSAAVHGGGIHNDTGTIELGNTIVASNSRGNCWGTITDLGGNLTFGDDTCPGTKGDPKLGPLQDNDGPTHTMTLNPGSPAIDTAVPSICAAPPVNNMDQRGVTRPVDGDGDDEAICDVGAFEYRPIRPIYLPLIEGP